MTAAWAEAGARLGTEIGDGVWGVQAAVEGPAQDDVILITGF